MSFKQIELNDKDILKIFSSNTPTSRVIRIVKNTFFSVFSLAVVFFIVFALVNYSAYFNRFNYNLGNIAKVEIPNQETILIYPAPPIPDYNPEIIISKLGLQAPLRLDIAPTDIIEQLKYGVVHYQYSATPDTVGNVVLVGHSSDFPWSNGSYKTIFSLLDKLVVGDEIVVPYKQDKYVYAVTESKVVPATELSVLKKTDSSILTLITCYPVGTSQKRLIIRAKLVSGKTSGLQQTDPLTSESLPTVR